MTFDLSREMERRIKDADASISRVLARRAGLPATGPITLTPHDMAAIASLDPAEQDSFVTALLDMESSLHVEAARKVRARDLQPGMTVLVDGKPCKVADIRSHQHIPGGGANPWVQMQVRFEEGSPYVATTWQPHEWVQTVDESKTSSLRTVAHDSGDGETIFHCPFCGSGQVIGGSDGTTSCDFCGTHFTVQVQPEFAAMPQTVDGTPYPMPGMPGSGTDTAEGADSEDDVDAAQDDANQQGAQQQAPGGPAADPSQVDAQGQPIPPNVRQQLAASLTTNQFLARYALRHADDRDGVLRRVRAINEAQRES